MRADASLGVSRHEVKGGGSGLYIHVLWISLKDNNKGAQPVSQVRIIAYGGINNVFVLKTGASTLAAGGS